MNQQKKIIIPKSIRIDACSVCQLDCLLCRIANEQGNKIIGKGFLKFNNFKKIIDQNNYLRKVELANWGEALLNSELPEILKYAYESNITTNINEGANLNHAPLTTLEALVKYKTKRIRCAIDGITNNTYQRYRVGGSLKRVIRNIQTINEFKEKYQSEDPRLIFQFIVFGHNEHEMARAVLLAKMLKMELFFKLNIFNSFSPVRNEKYIRKYLRYINRKEYLEFEGRHYMRHLCYQLWRSPQINWDGKLLGCNVNTWTVYAENVFLDGLINCVNNEKMVYARNMLMGKAPPREDIPCINCSIFKSIKNFKNWITEKEIEITQIS